MCGILGYFGNHVNDFNEKVKLNVISHRGPDSEGYTSGEKYYLGHTRLSILDLSSNGSQPMFCSQRTHVLTFNGEIYNHLELRDTYLSSVNFQSTSDTETLLYGLIHYGEDFINKLNGIFCFAFLNLSTNDFIIAKDPFGVKPLYYYISEAEMLFCSELKGVMPYISAPTIDEDALKNYINFLWSPGDKTPVKEIKKLLQGNLIKGNLNRLSDIQFKEYFSLSFDKKKYSKLSENELIDLLDEKLTKAVERQLLSDVPLGFFLSGGLDSSLLVAIAKKLNPNKRLTCFTVKSEGVTDEGFVGDYHYAKEVAKWLDVDLVTVDSESNIMEDFDKIVFHLDEPQADPAPIHVSNICREARKRNIKILIGGVAGDDIFAGYRRHRALLLEKKLRKIPVWIIRIIQKALGLCSTNFAIVRRLNKLLRNIHLPEEASLYGYFDWINHKKLNDLFLKNKPYDIHYYFKELLSKVNKEDSNLNKLLFLEINTFLSSHNLNYTDKLSMSNGIEARVPYLDLELVEFSTTIPPELKLKGNTTKYILKKVAERYLPKEIIYRPKTGFGAPVRTWIINNMNELINDYLSKEVIEKRKIFNYEKVWGLIEQNKKGKDDLSYPIWAILAIESWMRQFIDKK